MLKFPYAIRTFETIINEDYIYVDRTHHISFLEEWGRELLFLRPRRFGKSLLLSIMMDYYDVAKADDFERLFGELAIGQNPTPLHNQYMVMRWDLSKVRSHGTVEQIEADLHDCINSEIKSFYTDYRHILPQPIEINPTNALVSFYATLDDVRAAGHKLYLFVDEYDNFANEVMMSVRNSSGQPILANRYEALVTGEGLFKTFFKNLKNFGSGRGLERVFITGVSPIVMPNASKRSQLPRCCQYPLRRKWNLS